MRSPNWFLTTVKGSKQGDFKKEGVVKGQESWIPIYSVAYEVMSPHDVATGQPSGKRQHQPFTICKTPGASSPQWWQALVSNETISTVQVDRYEMRNATQIKTLSFQLTNATVLDWSIETLEEAAAGEARPSEYLLEEIKLAFQKIVIEYAPAKTTAQDDWYATS